MSSLYKNDIVVSSRIRLARNFECVNFPLRESDDEAKWVKNNISSCLSSEFDYVSLKELDYITLNSLIEKHIISKELVDNKDISGYFIKDNIVIMCNEEDHIREQIVLQGYRLNDALNELKVVDEKLLTLDIAIDKKLGFLTACPSNLGTGMRASVMLFLPALSLSGMIKTLAQSAHKNGLTIRGCFGEGSKAQGNMFQISNQVTLGLGENEIIEKVKSFVDKIVTLEADAREGLVETKLSEIKNTTFRAYGVLTNSYKITTGEMYKYLSELKLGVDLELITLKNPQIISDLFVECLPNVLMKNYGKKMLEEERDIKRAEILSKSLSNQKII